MGICRAANVSLMIELIFMQRNYCMPNLFTTTNMLMKIKLVGLLNPYKLSATWEKLKGHQVAKFCKSHMKRLSKQETARDKVLVLYYTLNG